MLPDLEADALSRQLRRLPSHTHEAEILPTVCDVAPPSNRAEWHFLTAVSPKPQSSMTRSVLL